MLTPLSHWNKRGSSRPIFCYHSSCEDSGTVQQESRSVKYQGQLGPFTSTPLQTQGQKRAQIFLLLNNTMLKEIHIRSEALQ